MILGKGERIHAATIALLASQGFTDLIVGGNATAAVISTGDELVSRAKNFRQATFTTAIPCCSTRSCSIAARAATTVEHCRDDRESLGAAIKRGTKNHVLIITGGVSVGEHDLVKEALRELGAKIEIWRVAIKPGKPFLIRKHPAGRHPHLTPLSAPPSREPGPGCEAPVRVLFRELIVSSSVCPGIPCLRL